MVKCDVEEHPRSFMRNVCIENEGVVYNEVFKIHGTQVDSTV